MIRTGLDFAPGTTDDSKALVGRLCTPNELFGAYRTARHAFGTGDLVLTVSEQDPSGFEARPRASYVRHVKTLQGPKPLPIFLHGLASKSAQAVMNMPAESDAMWLIVVRGPQEIPVMSVIYATPYAIGDESAAQAN